MFNIRTLVMSALALTTLVNPTPIRATPTVAPGNPSCAGITYATLQTPECDVLMAAQPYPDVMPSLTILA